ncbi:unnamed protein product [Paramecium sonneborni]|uniref:EGF-like domain-containing protein n=1 Tax=Paramecium sonneborni TaxID=65129 RepID=A0A8S1RJH0_9CILI|nr:unnamed protein product [Paramecium sonneborni]
MGENNIFFLLILSGILYQTQCACPSYCQCSGGSSICNTCNPDYYKSGNNCYACTKPCATCSTNATTCTACVDTTNQVISTCACNNGLIMNTSTYLCENCPSNCKVCSSSTICTSCNDNYWLNGNSCSPCIKPCLNCSSSGSNCSTCVDTTNQTPSSCSCPSNYIMNTSNYFCNQCQFPCATCQTTVSYCLTCASTYTIDSSTHTCSCQNNQFEVNSTPKTCQNCSSLCQTCTLSATNCGSCVGGLHRHLDNNQCICDNGYYENTTCQPCQLPCINCTSLSVCTSCNDSTYQSGTTCQCQATYFMNASFMCQSCVAPCQNCTSEMLCTSCISNYYKSGNTCIQCTSPCYNCVDFPTKCTSCVNTNVTPINNVCGSCSDGYFTDASLNCQSCIHPCTKCQTNGNHCLECATTFEMSTTTPNTCVCPANKYLVVTNTPNNCQTCTQPCNTCLGTAVHCLSCIDTHQTVDGSNQCVCNVGFFMNGVNCGACVTPCLECLGTANYCTECKDIRHYKNNGQCICNSGYVNDNDFNCIPCQDPCLICSVNDTHCDSCRDSNHQINASYECICKDTYYSNAIDTCAPCVLPCKLCDSNGCLTCIDTNQIINSSKNCICKPGFYEVGLNCSQCATPCKTCEIDQNRCLTCIDIHQTQISNQCICNDGYFEVNHICQECQPPCNKCQNTDDYCLSCVDINHDLINNKCVCKYGYGQSGTNGTACSLCQQPCLDCSTSVNTCLSCIDTSIFHLDNDKCLCQQGYFSVGTNCVQCSSQCSTCIDVSNKCLRCSDPNSVLNQNDCNCKPGYYQNNSMICEECQLPCLTCISNSNYCTSCHNPGMQQAIGGQCICIDGYYIINNQCEKCNQICSKCDSYNNCTQCIDGHYLQNQKCLKCQTPCQSCFDEYTCKTCTDNYIMNNLGICIQCIQNCKNCIDSLSCITCFDQFYYGNQSCIPCSQKCQTCENDSKFCTSCQNTSQILIDNQCHCKDGYFEEDLDCKPCDQLCKLCRSLSYCTECIKSDHVVLEMNLCVCQDGFYLENKSCQLCDKKCQTCTQKSDDCLTCNSQMNRVKQQNACICQDGYFENDNKDCWPCNSDEGKIIKNCKYKNCNDKVWTYEEECDDGNEESRDGCTNCKIDEQYSCINILLQPSFCFKCGENCQECQIIESNKLSVCTKCNQGYFLIQDRCSQCAEKCLDCKNSASNCISCKYQQNQKGECQLCQSGYYFDEFNKKCISKCGDSIKTVEEECDDGNLLSGDGCNQNCKKEKKFICKDGICIIPEYPVPMLFSYGDIQLYNNIRKFKLEYNLFLNIPQDNEVEKMIKLFIKKQTTLNPIDCPYEMKTQYTLNNSSNISFSIDFQIFFNRSTTKEEFLIEYLNPSYFLSSQGYPQILSEVSTTIPEYIFIDQAQVNQVEMAGSSNSILLYIMAVMAGGAILFGGLDIFYNLLDTIQMLSYLKYINTQFPFNLQTFFDFFGFAQLSFFSKYLNLQELIDPFIDYEDLKQIPEKIQIDGLNSLFVINGSSILFVWLTLIAVYVFSKYLPHLLFEIKLKYYNEIPGQIDFALKFKFWILAIKILIIQLCLTVVQEFFYSGILRTFFATAYDYSFSMTLQLFALELDSQNALVKFSSFLAIIALGIYFFTIYVITKKCGNQKFSIEEYQYRLKYMSLFEGIKYGNYSKYFYSISLTKKFLFMLILIFCYEQPYFQVLNLILLSIIEILWLTLFQPLDDLNEFIKQTSCEINKSIALFLISGLVLDQEVKIFSENIRSIIGWICVGNISLILVIQLIIDAIQQWVFLIKKYKKFRRLVEKFYQFWNPQKQKADHSIFK